MTGSLKRIVYAVLGILAAIIFLPSLCSSQQRRGSEAYNYDLYAKPNEGRIRGALVSRLQEQPSPVCVATPRLPYDSSETSATCDVCDKLADAGLVEKSVETVLRNEQPVVAVRYALTEAGRPLYTEALRDGARADAAGLCFGRLVLDDMTLRVPAVMTTKEVTVRYVAKVEDAHALLYGPHARTLGLPQFTRGSLDGTRLPVQFLSAQLDASGAFQSLQ